MLTIKHRNINLRLLECHLLAESHDVVKSVRQKRRRKCEATAPSNGLNLTSLQVEFVKQYNYFSICSRGLMLYKKKNQNKRSKVQ